MEAVRITPSDNVAVVLQPVSPGDAVSCGAVELRAVSKIPQGHKIALAAIPAGADIIKYGVTIGRASSPIAAGEHVHTQNVTDITEQLCAAYEEAYRQEENKECKC